MKVAGGTKAWAINVTTHTTAGIATSAGMGTALGASGDLVLQNTSAHAAAGVALAASAVAIARELGWVRFHLPQPKRQTSRMWARSFNGSLVPALWGADLGLTFTTRLTFGGPWVLAIVAFVAGDAGLGAGIFSAYWAGRALPVWLGALMLPAADATPQLMEDIKQQHRVAQLVHVGALAAIALILVQTLMSPIHHGAFP